MDRTGTPEYKTERDFLLRMKARVEREIARRIRGFADAEPDLRREIEDYVRTPLAEWQRPLRHEVGDEFHLLKLEEATIDDLLEAIGDRGLIHEIFRRIGHLQEEELQIESEAGFAYLRRPQYWSDEQALGVLNHLFKRWDDFAHGRRREGP